MGGSHDVTPLSPVPGIALWRRRRWRSSALDVGFARRCAQASCWGCCAYDAPVPFTGRAGGCDIGTGEEAERRLPGPALGRACKQ